MSSSSEPPRLKHKNSGALDTHRQSFMMVSGDTTIMSKLKTPKNPSPINCVECKRPMRLLKDKLPGNMTRSTCKKCDYEVIHEGTCKLSYTYWRGPWWREYGKYNHDKQTCTIQWSIGGVMVLIGELSFLTEINISEMEDMISDEDMKRIKQSLIVYTGCAAALKKVTHLKRLSKISATIVVFG